jgi:hypothetical protein
MLTCAEAWLSIQQFAVEDIVAADALLDWLTYHIAKFLYVELPPWLSADQVCSRVLT